MMNIREEVEQNLINESVRVDTKNCANTAKLPLMCNPSQKLCPNKHKVLKGYNQQLRKLQ